MISITHVDFLLPQLSMKNVSVEDLRRSVIKSASVRQSILGNSRRLIGDCTAMIVGENLCEMKADGRITTTLAITYNDDGDSSRRNNDIAVDF